MKEGLRLGAPDVARGEQLVERVSLHAEKIVLQWEDFDVQGVKAQHVGGEQIVKGKNRRRKKKQRGIEGSRRREGKKYSIYYLILNRPFIHKRTSKDQGIA